MGIQMSTEGDVYITGGFSGSQDFDPDPASTSVLTASGYDTYLQKLNADGSFAWAVKAATEGNPTEIEILADGRIIVAGRSDVDATVMLSDNNTLQLNKGLFFLEINPSGQLIHAYSISVPAPA